MVRQNIMCQVRHEGVRSWLCRLLCVAIIAVRGCQAACADLTFDPTCICLDDARCRSAANLNSVGSFALNFHQPCLCRDGGKEVPLEQLAEILMERNGTVDSLHISGNGIASLQPLDGLLKRVKYSLVIIDTTLRSLRPLAGLQFVGDLDILRNGILEDIGLGGSIQVNGSVLIQNNDMLANVDGLGNVTHVNGNLQIRRNHKLLNVDGLGNIVLVNGALRLKFNRMLANINGLGKVAIVNGDLEVDSNPVADVDGLGSITKVNGSLTFTWNAMLTNLNGLGNISEVNGDLLIENNGMLANVEGLSKLAVVNGDLTIRNNDILSNVDGLGSLSTVKGTLELSGNSKLENIDGLGSVEQVKGGVTIQSNDMIGNVNGVANITNVIGSLRVQSNNMLVNVDGMKRIKQINGSLNILSNANLTNLGGLGGITEVNGSLQVARNAVLANVDGLGNVTQVNGPIWIQSNDMLSNVDGLGNITLVNGFFQITSNGILESVGLSSIHHVNGSLLIESNAKLKGISRLGTITRVNGDLLVEGGASATSPKPKDLPSVAVANISQVSGDLVIRQNDLANLQGLGGITHVQGELHLSQMEFVGYQRFFESLVDVQGSVTIEDVKLGVTSFVGNNKDPVYALLLRLANVGGSVVLERNIGLDLRWSNLRTFCSGATARCSMVIDSNVFHQRGTGTLHFGDLFGSVNGTLSITRNEGLRSVEGFGQLSSLKRSEGLGRSGRTGGGLIIAANPNLTSVYGFDFLEAVEGDIEILNNPRLHYVNLKKLSIVEGETRLRSNGANFTNFESLERLPHIPPGCRLRRSDIPASQALVTSFVHKVCVVEILAPSLVGAAIVAMLMLMTVVLLYSLASHLRSPYKGRISFRRARDMFASNVLALADVLSDMGFVVTAFVLWNSKSKEGLRGVDAVRTGDHVELLIIGSLSAAVLLFSQLFVVVSIYVGLKTIHTATDGNEPGMPLLDHLKEERRMEKGDWLLLFPGLLFFDVEVIKYLPWEQNNVANDDRADDAGFPHKYFARVATMARVLEDLPQIALQVAFICVIEEDDGWAITGTMASLTLSIADVMVKLVFPVLMKRLAANRRRIIRVDAMAKRCHYCQQEYPRCTNI